MFNSRCPLAAVWLIGNIGREEGRLLWAVLGAYLVVLFTPFFGITVLNWCSIVSVVIFHLFGRKWRRTPYPFRSKKKRFAQLTSASIAFSLVFCSFLYFNATIKTNNNEEIKLRDAVGNFLKSPMFQDIKTNTYKIYNDTWHEGPTKAFGNMIDLLDPTGRKHARKVLDLPKNATQEEIKTRVRELSKKYHPDKQLSETEEGKKNAELRFREVQEASDVLLDSKRRRMKNKKRSHEDL